MSKKMIVTNQYLWCSNCGKYAFMCESFKLTGRWISKYRQQLFLMAGTNYFIFWNVSTINMIVSYLHLLIISNTTLLVFISHRNRIGERRGNNRTQEMNFVCLLDPQKNRSQKSCHKFSKVLFTSLIIYFLLLTILFSSASISKYAVGQVNEEKRNVH